MFFKIKNTHKDKAPSDHHARMMRSKYASLMMNYYASKDLLDEDDEKNTIED